MTNKANPKVRKAEAAAGPASSKKAKVGPYVTEPKKKELTSTKTAASRAPNKKPVSNETRTNTSNSQGVAPFAWKACANDKEKYRRLEIKEEAVRQGLRHADRVVSAIEPFLRSSSDSTKTDSCATEELQKLSAQLGMYHPYYLLTQLLVLRAKYVH